ncbi:hypothetical protein MMC13_004938 [Lambiella insularis]|nr:hypothetical protein [Lambiella insularis]
MPADLRPKRRGLEVLHEELQSKYGRLRNDTRVNIVLLHALDHLSLLDLADLIYGVEHPIAFRQSYAKDLNQASVQVNGGLCFIMDSVIKLSDGADDALRVHIVPGHVEWSGRTHTIVKDGKISEPLFIMPLIVLPTSKLEYEAQIRIIDSMTAQAVVTESSDCLRMSYEIKTASGTFFLGPSQLSRDIARAAVEVSCLGKRCRPFDGLYTNFLFTLHNLRLPYNGFQNQKIPFDIPEEPNIVLFGEHKLARCTALVGGSHFSRIILQGRECIACCARRALTAEKPHEVLIVSHLTVEDAEQLLGRPLLHEA